MQPRPRSAKAAAAPTTSPKSLPAYERCDVNTALILEPLKPARETFDERKLEELTVSVRQLGIIVPLIVEREGKNVRVHAGHRRLIVARALELPAVPCHVYPAGQVPGEAMKAHENAFREDLNPGEEAKYFGTLLESECGGDVDRLCALVQMSRAYVESRLLLLMGDPKVLDALGASTISIGVAKELNLVKDAARRFMFLDAAMQGGASVRMVRDWRVQAEAGDKFATVAVETPTPSSAAAGEVASFRMQCLLCDGADAPHDMELVYMHRGCRRLILDRFLDTIRASSPAAVNGATNA